MDERRDRGEIPGMAAAETPILPYLLNVLVRRWRILAAGAALGIVAGLVYGFVVGPYYRATAVVRPGIVSFAIEGGPIREWRHRDVINWFDKDLYWDHLRATIPQLHLPPDIIAEYLPSGGLYQESGDVIVLQNLAEDPELGRRILDGAIAAFNQQGLADGANGGTLHLTRIGIELELANLTNTRANTALDAARIENEIIRKRVELARLTTQAQGLDLDLERAGAEGAAARSYLATARQTVAASNERLASVRTTLDRLMAGAESAAMGEFAQAVAAMDEQFFTVRVAADTLRHAIRSAELDSLQVLLQRDEELALDRDLLESEVADLELRRDRELPIQLATIDAQITTQSARLSLLTLLEQIGETRVTDRPVRPRKLRALAILTTLGLGSAVGLAYVAEYLGRNRRAILSRTAVR